MKNFIVGFCRFSFLGRGDWPSYKNVQVGDEAQIYEKIAAEIYAPLRMEQRLWTFEKITLPSIAHQTDKRFKYYVVTSMDMPQAYLSRLKELCEKCEQIELVVTGERNLGAVLNPILQSLWDEYEDVVQFRLDDDDAIATNYIEKIYDYSNRMSGLGAFAITFRKGITAVVNPNEDLWYAIYDRAFQSPASIVRFTFPNRTVFDVGHYAMERRYNHIQDVQTLGTFMLQWPSASRSITLDRLPSDWEVVAKWKFNKKCEEQFPFLSSVDFSFLKELSRAQT